LNYDLQFVIYFPDHEDVHAAAAATAAAAPSATMIQKVAAASAPSIRGGAHRLHVKHEGKSILMAYEALKAGVLDKCTAESRIYIVGHSYNVDFGIGNVATLDIVKRLIGAGLKKVKRVSLVSCESVILARNLHRLLKEEGGVSTAVAGRASTVRIGIYGAKYSKPANSATFVHHQAGEKILWLWAVDGKQYEKRDFQGHAKVGEDELDHERRLMQLTHEKLTKAAEGAAKGGTATATATATAAGSATAPAPSAAKKTLYSFAPTQTKNKDA
jgi:hypothetical protein